MKIYKVKVNGKVYEVELESVTEKIAITEVSVPSLMKQENLVKPVVNVVELRAPMQGTILAIKVNIGEKVTKGQALVILEAMKLENEIVSPVDGVIKEILVSKGLSVQNQQLLLIIE